MSTPPSSLLEADRTDADLILRVRAGSDDAYAELFRRHRGVALGVARSLAGASGGDDLVAEAFARVLAQIRKGGGPETFFRSYLLASVRRLHLNQIRATKREVLVDTHTNTEAELLIGDGVEARADGNTVAAAFAALPERWRQVLWLGAVEGRSNDEIADLLGLRPNAVAALSFRAREGLRTAYLREHLQVPADEACRTVVDRLPAYLRGTLTPRRRTQVAEHLDSCTRCAALLVELEGVSRRLAFCPVPFALTALAVGGSLGIPSGSVSGALGFLAAPVKGLSVAGLVTAGVAGVAVIAALHGTPQPDPGAAGEPERVVTLDRGDRPSAVAPPDTAADGGGAGPRREVAAPRPVPESAPAPSRAHPSPPEASSAPDAPAENAATDPPEPAATPAPAARVGVVRWQILGGRLQVQVPRLESGWTVRSVAPRRGAAGWDCPPPAPDPTSEIAVSRTTCTLDLAGADLSVLDVLSLLDLRLVPPAP